MKPDKKGFTLTELLIVVLVMGILAAIATPLYLRTIKKSRASDALNVLTAAAERQESYFINNGKYAAGFTELGAPIKGLEGDNTTTTSGVKVGNFKYQMSDSCVSAVSLAGNPSSDEDDYVIYKNFVTQQEGCVGKGCEVLEGVIDHVSSVGCTAVIATQEKEDPGSATDPCIANPSLCCPAGTTWNGTKCAGMECETGKVYDSLKKACVCAIQCASGLGVLNETNCTCTCSNTCSGGQVIDAGCNCTCPSNMPNWNAATSSCAPTCPSPKTRWNGTECACPLDTPLFTGTACVACPVSKPWNGTECACPSELPYEWGGKCMACNQSSYNSLKAACESTQSGPAGTWTGVMCSCDCREENSAFKNGHCACPTSKPYWTGSACEVCPDIQTWDGSNCVCPSDKPKWENGSCVAENKCTDATYAAANKCECDPSIYNCCTQEEGQAREIIFNAETRTCSCPSNMYLDGQSGCRCNDSYIATHKSDCCPNEPYTNETCWSGSGVWVYVSKTEYRDCGGNYSDSSDCGYSSPSGKACTSIGDTCEISECSYQGGGQDWTEQYSGSVTKYKCSGSGYTKVGW